MFYKAIDKRNKVVVFNLDKVKFISYDNSNPGKDRVYHLLSFGDGEVLNVKAGTVEDVKSYEVVERMNEDEYK